MTVVLFTLLCVLICGSLALSPKAQTKTSDERDVTPNTVTGRNGKIAFSSDRDGNSEIYATEADGSNVQRLTNNPASDSSPKWSPNGTKIAFASSRDDTSVGCTSGGSCKHEIYVMNADGTNQTRTNNPGFDDSFDWSPDSTRIVFESFHDGSFGFNTNISVMNADGSNVRRLTNYPGFDYSPKWSPDGTKIAFLRADDNFAVIPEIYVMNADGTNQTRSNLWGYDSRWSPNGTKIVFVSADIFDATTQEIYVMNADGSNVQRLTNNQTGDSSPAWSPDGSKITFTRACQHNRCPTQQPPHIWVVNADGSNPTQLTDILAYGSAWSPDGTKIIFGGPSSGASDLFVINPDGSGLTNITNTSGKYEWSPSWQPLSLPPVVNPIDDPQFFVRQHYLDFLNREPDGGALAYWTNRIAECGSDARCIHERRIGVSAAFFVELEFQDTGYYVYRFYKASFGRQPNYAEFTSDRSKVIDSPNPEANKQAFADEWVQRTAFTQAYPITMGNTEFVNKLFDTAGLTASIYDPQRQQEITAMNSGRSRALVLRDVIEIPDFKSTPDPNSPRYAEVKQTSQYNPAFVLMQYFGYLRRNMDQGGYDHWLDVLNNRAPNNYHAMVCAFLTSAEYQLRFGTSVTRTNQDCGP